MKLELEIPNEFLLVGLEQTSSGWRAALRDGPLGQLQSFPGRTAQEAIDISASALRARLRETPRPEPRLKIQLDLSSFIRSQ